MPSSKERLQAFIDELAALSARHGLWVVGCGCCGSPALYTHEDLVDDGQKVEQYSVREDGECLAPRYDGETLYEDKPYLLSKKG